GRLHRDPAEVDLWVCPKIVVPGGVPGSAGIGCDDRNLVAVVEVDDRVATPRAASGTARLQDCSREHECSGEPTAADTQQERVELPGDVARDEASDAARGERRISAGECASRTGGVYVSEFGGHETTSVAASSS